MAYPPALSAFVLFSSALFRSEPKAYAFNTFVQTIFSLYLPGLTLGLRAGGGMVGTLMAYLGCFVPSFAVVYGIYAVPSYVSSPLIRGTLGLRGCI